MKKALKKTWSYLYNDGLKSRLFQTIALLLSFVVPFILSVTLFKAHNYYPFAKDGNTLMMVDMRGQYIAFFRYYKSFLDGDVSIFYTLGKATGGDFLSIFTYYLASPFNLILKFFTLENLPAGLMWIVVLKIATSSVTSYIALTKTNKLGYANLMFSFSYALIAYSFVYYSNIMWLDGVILLPLVTLGIVTLTKGESPLLYIISLAFTIMTSWYIGIMIAMFSVFFFLVEFTDYFKRWFYDKRKVLTFGVSSLLAGVISFAYWGTALFTIIGTKGSASFTNIGQAIKDSLDFVAIQKGFFGLTFDGFVDISNNKTVSFYVGIIPLALTLLSFFRKDTSLRAKVSRLILLVIYIFAFNNRGINDLFHGGPTPNWFPGRYAFIFGFILVFYGAQTLAKLDTLHWSGFFFPPILSALLMTTLKKKGLSFEVTFLNYYGAAYLLLISYYIYLRFKNHSSKPLPPPLKYGVSPVFLSLLSLIAILNVYGNNNHILTAYNTTTTLRQHYDVYAQDEKLARAIDFLKTTDQSLYRTEKSFLRSGTYNNADNDSLYYGYNGISHYSSSDKQATLQYLKKLGFHYNNYNLNYANGSTLAVNAFLGVKYLIDNGRNLNFDLGRYLPKVDFIDDYTIYQNNYALPFLFGTTMQNSTYIGDGKYLPDNSIYWFDKFEFQNEIFKNLTDQVVDEDGEKKEIFKKADVVKTLDNVNPLPQKGPYRYATSGPATIKYRVALTESTNYYYFFDQRNYSNDHPVSVNLLEGGRGVTYFSYHGHQINGLSKRNITTTLSILVSGETPDLEVRDAIYYEDHTVLEEYIAAIKAQAPVRDLTQITTAQYDAKVTTLRDNQAMLMTLPHHTNMHVYVDGKRVESLVRFNIYTGFVIKNAGEHRVVIKYVEPTFSVGLPVGIFIFGATIFAHFKFKKYFTKDEALG